MGFITIWKEVIGLALLLLHLVHATEQPQSKIWRQKKAPFIAHLWWLVLLALHMHTHTNFSSKEEGFRNPFPQLLAVIDPPLLIPTTKPHRAPLQGARPAAPDPRAAGRGERGCSPPLGRLFNFLRFMFFFSSQVFHKNAAVDLAGSSKLELPLHEPKGFLPPFWQGWGSANVR